MKNIHVLPTDKPSRLYYFGSSSELRLTKYPNPFRAFERSTQNIYITTSDEEIKEGDFVIEYIFDNLVFKVCSITSKNVQKSKFNSFPKKHCKKIILTTDQDLIKDGVQAIDDEFLEWFVNNPNCEWIEVEKEKVFDGFLDPQQGSPKWRFDYKIIIPKEEPKQDLEKEMFELEQELDIPSHLRWHNSKPKQKTLPKQETLEEAITLANKILHDLNFDKHRTTTKIITEALLTFSSKWQQEQDKNKYSEEDLKQFAFECVGNFLSNRENELEIELVNVISDRNDKLFEKFKNK